MVASISGEQLEGQEQGKVQATVGSWLVLDYTEEQDLTSEGNFLLSYYKTELSTWYMYFH